MRRPCPGAALRLRQRIDRRRLPAKAHVIWAWWLGHWIAPDWFCIGGVEFRPRGPFVFRREPRYPGWLLGRVLDQGLEGSFKQGAKGRLEFEEAYPGEDPVLEMTIDVLESAGR